jgi:hypothetical protein
MRRIGSFTPVDEWTQVTPRARVPGPISRRTRSTISSSEASAGIVVEGDPARDGPRLTGCHADGLVMGVVVVGRRQDLLARL